MPWLFALILLQPLYGPLPGLTGWASNRRNIHTLTPILVINYPLSAFSIYNDPWHPPCSIYVPDSLLAQLLLKSSLVYLLVWHPPLHTPYISSPNHCLLFAAHVHTVATCFAAVPRLCYLILVFFSTLYLELYLLPQHHISIWPFSSLPAEVPLHFLLLQARCYFHATYYFAHSCTVSMTFSVIHPCW